MQNTQELFTLKKKNTHTQNTKQNIAHHSLGNLAHKYKPHLGNCFAYVLLHITHCTQKKRRNYTCATKHKIQDQTLVTTDFGGHMSLIHHYFSMFGSTPHPASHALFQPKTRLKP
jgi:hypothetical protein